MHSYTVYIYIYLSMYIYTYKAVGMYIHMSKWKAETKTGKRQELKDSKPQILESLCRLSNGTDHLHQRTAQKNSVITHRFWWVLALAGSTLQLIGTNTWIYFEGSQKKSDLYTIYPISSTNPQSLPLCPIKPNQEP